MAHEGADAMRLKVHSLRADDWEGQAELSRDGQTDVLMIDHQPITPRQAEDRDLEVIDADEREIARLRAAGYHLRGTWSEQEIKDAAGAMRSFIRWRKGSEFEIADFAAQLNIHPTLAAIAAEHLEANGELMSTSGRYRLQTFGMD
jgi:hypothetical protein